MGVWNVVTEGSEEAGAKHPSIRIYLEEPTEQGYQDLESPLYQTLLAEVVAEALNLLYFFFRTRCSSTALVIRPSAI